MTTKEKILARHEQMHAEMRRQYPNLYRPKGDHKMSAMKEQDWVELSITLTSEDIQSLQVSAYWSDLSGIIEHIVTLAKDKQAAKETTE